MQDIAPNASGGNSCLAVRLELRTTKDCQEDKLFGFCLFDFKFLNRYDKPFVAS